LHSLGDRQWFIDWALWKGRADTLAAANKIYDLYAGWRTSVDCVAGAMDLYRITFSVEMQDGRHENFVTYYTRR
jgi:hypothetical protein